MSLKLLNLGCGSRFHADWVNVDGHAQAPEVINHDLRQALPFQADLFDAVYHSHVLEHFPRRLAPRFIGECFRVLKPGGIIRVVVPDLEDIARTYLRVLQCCLEGEPEAEDKYQWITLELLDQMVRERSGGDMLRYWMQDPMPAERFVLEREPEAAVARAWFVYGPGVSAVADERGSERPSAEEVGAFRLGGEPHLWMYDRYSLPRLLRQGGFRDVQLMKPDQSLIPEFGRYHLDVGADGKVWKPMSVFAEGRRPDGQ